MSRARGFGAFIGANAETLDSAPALGTLSSEKMGDHRFPPLGFSRCGFSLACCCNLAASWCLASLI